MFVVQETEFGIYLRVTGAGSVEESKKILAELRQIFESRERGISIFVDLQQLDLLSNETQTVAIEIQQMCLEHGIKRTAVILANPTVAYQFKRLALKSGIFNIERYLDASTDIDWEAKGLAWVTDGIDPDAELREKIARNRTKQYNSVSD